MLGYDDVRTVVLQRFHKIFIITDRRCFHIDEFCIVALRDHLQKLLILLNGDLLFAAFLFSAARKDDRLPAGMTHLGGDILRLLQIPDMRVMIRAEFDQVAVDLIRLRCQLQDLRSRFTDHDGADLRLAGSDVYVFHLDHFTHAYPSFCNERCQTIYRVMTL